jgi:hypothetical protein
MVIHIFRSHISLANLSGRAVRMIALIDQKVTGEDVEPFVQEIDIYVGEGKELSEDMKHLPRDSLLSPLESHLQSSPRRLSLQGPVRLPLSHRILHFFLLRELFDLFESRYGFKKVRSHY